MTRPAERPLYLHLVPTERPSVLDLDAAARLSGADCAAINGDGDREVMEESTTRLLFWFAAPFVFYSSAVVGGWVVMVLAWVAGL